jgi:hypothetical protein
MTRGRAKELPAVGSDDASKHDVYALTPAKIHDAQLTLAETADTTPDRRADLPLILTMLNIINTATEKEPAHP